MKTIRPLLALAVLPLLVPFLAACTASQTSSRGIVIDGDLSDWRGGRVASADADAVYFRFSPGRTSTLQANDETTRLVFDLDDDPATGKALQGPPSVGRLGVDLEILYSPPLDALDPGRVQQIRSRSAQRGEAPPEFTGGLTVLRHHDGGAMTRHTHADAGFVTSPTYASEWYEARIDRHAPAVQGTGLDRAGTATGIVLVTDSGGGVIRYSEPFRFVLPEAAPARRQATASIPPQQSGTVRVLSMNVLRGKPLTEPAPFARLIAAIEPDVLLLQEGDGFTPESLEAWLSGYVGPLPTKHEWASGVQGLAGGVGAWDAVAFGEHGVAIATPHLITGVYDERLMVTDPNTGVERTVRAIFALVSTPRGDVLACSTHMKCCGSAGSPEDLLRLAEADAINRRFAELAELIRMETGREISARVIGGDVNLVGSREPLERLGAGLDRGGGDLAVVDTPVLGDSVYYTWREDRSAFGPGRLDWILVGGMRTTQAFAVDTRLIDPGTLAGLGLESEDSAVSDHLPIVVDLRP